GRRLEGDDRLVPERGRDEAHGRRRQGRGRPEGGLDVHGAGVAVGPADRPLPAYAGAGRASILGGGNSVISAYSKNPGGALAVVDFLASQDWQTTLTAEFSQMSPMKATY